MLVDCGGGATKLNVPGTGGADGAVDQRLGGNGGGAGAQDAPNTGVDLALGSGGSGGAAGDGGGARDLPAPDAPDVRGTEAADAGGVDVSVGAGGVAGTGGTLGSGGTVLVDGALGSGGTAGAGGALASGGARGTGGVSGSSGTATGCSVTQVTATPAPTDMLLLLDRSGSMNYSIAEDCYCDPGLATGGTVAACADLSVCTTRWSGLSFAVKTTLENTPDIQWGLKLFSTPGGTSCAVNSGVEVQVAAGSAGAITSQVDGVAPANNTPTAAAVTAATAYLKTVADGNNKVILLATDGEPNCKPGGSSSSPDVEGTTTAIRAAAKAGFLVYVVGIGPSVGNLDNFAVAGGTGSYYPAMSPAALATALTSIAKAAATCTFTTAQSPPDPNAVAVYLDGVLVPQSASSGWTYGADTRSIVLTGSYCGRVMDKPTSTVQVEYGCPSGAGGAGGGHAGAGGIAATGGAGGAGGTGGATPDSYVWVAIQDTEQAACTTNSPGADIDAVALWGATGALGWGKIGSAVFTANPMGNMCENADCAGGNCKYAAISNTFISSSLVAYTEGANDAHVSATVDDSGYFALNGGTLQIQIGDLTGGGPAKGIKSGDMLKVFELDQTYITSGAAPATCSCLPEHFTVFLQTATGRALALKPSALAPDNTLCTGLTAASTEGCGTTVFLVP
jgi:hypothetical protein